MKYKELMLIDYINAIKLNLLIPINLFNYKFKWIMMCDDYINNEAFNKDDCNKINNLKIAIRYD